MKRPEVNFNDELGYMEVEGVKYSYRFFQELGVGGLKVGSLFRIKERSDSLVIEEDLGGCREEVKE